MPRGGVYFDAVIRQGVIDDDNLNPEDNLEEFQPLTDPELRYFKTSVESAAKTGRGVILSTPGAGLGDIALVPGIGMLNPKGIRDVEEWYVATGARRNYLHAIFERQTDIAIANMSMINDAAGGLIDAVFLCGTDFGTQTGTFCSRETFRELYMPYYKKMNGWIRKNTSWKVFKHSCGAIGSLLDDLLEAGFDIINPVQCSAAGMDPRELKTAYGDRLTFWGGGVDTQRVLPFGTAKEVAEQVAERCEIFAQNGGFVFNAIHNVQAGTPVENIAAMIETVKKINS
jgi:uroporphyrinogen-III decarboxylase